MREFFKSQILPIAVTTALSLLGFLCWNTIHNTSRIDSLTKDIGEIRDSLRKIVSLMMEKR